MESWGHAVCERADFVGATCPVLAAVRIEGDAGRSGAVDDTPNTEWALVGGRRRTGGREFLGDSNGGQRADDFGGRSRDARSFAQRIASFPAAGGFMPCPLEVSILRSAGSVLLSKISPL